MAGLLHGARICVRRWGAAAVVFYVAALALLALGHRCGGALSSPAACEGPSYHGGSAVTSADHTCGACEWQRASVPLPSPAPCRIALSEGECVAPALAAGRIRRRSVLAASPRGPPHS